MQDQADEVEKKMTQVTEEELEKLGATSDASGIWTFPDGSRGKFTERPITVYSDPQQTKLLGFAFFERIERVQ
jgi:hypothetical protein